MMERQGYCFTSETGPLTSEHLEDFTQFKEKEKKKLNVNQFKNKDSVWKKLFMLPRKNQMGILELRSILIEYSRLHDSLWTVMINTFISNMFCFQKEQQPVLPLSKNWFVRKTEQSQKSET